MKRLVPSLALTIFLSTAARSQNSHQERIWNPSIDDVNREFFLQGLEASEVLQTKAERRSEEFRQHQFIQKVHQFIAKWERFANDYNRKGVFNVKSAREISKAFHDLENTEGWPKAETTR